MPGDIPTKQIPGDPAARMGDTVKSHGALGQGASDVMPADQNLSGIGKSQAPASGSGNSTSASSPSGPTPLAEQREDTLRNAKAHKDG